MTFELLDGDMGRRTFALIFAGGDPMKRELVTFAKSQGLRTGHFTAIGAFEEVTLAFWDRDAKEYLEIPVREQVEVASLTGNLAIGPDGSPMVHAHAVVGKRDGTALAGHLVEGRVYPTLELMLTEAPSRLQREQDGETGLALIEV